ncbi:MAG: FtsQ-type POTRA domain-containing protein [Candidatus Liptonbacteria bacterium]|nr:FtsQ-type POTRA domain-containing protein [Candidatus Liptonbacteria bacterium]
MAKETPSSWSDVHSRDKRRRRRVIYNFLVALGYFAILGILWIFIYSPVFSVRNVEIIGNKNVSSDDIMTLAKSEVAGGSFWKRIFGMRNMLIWPERLSESLKYISELKSVSIEKDYGENKIKMIVEERKQFGSWCLKNRGGGQSPDSFGYNCFWFDPDGVIFQRSIGMEGNLIVVVNDYSQKKLGLNLKILPDEFIADMFSIFRAISSSGISVKEIRLNDLSLQEIEVDTYDGPKIYFSLRFSADNTAEVIKSLRQKQNFGSLQYIDFRVENRAYYK